MKKKPVNKYNKIMEKFWMTVAIVSGIIVIYLMIRDGVVANLQLLVFPALAGAMYAFRVSFRKRQEKMDNHNHRT